MLNISSDKVQHIIELAREFDVKVASWEDPGRTSDADESMDSALEDTGRDSVSSELATYIDELNVDEQDSLVALVWVGRGTYEAGEVARAIEMANAERVNKTSAYLMGIPLLADHIAQGVEKLENLAE